MMERNRPDPNSSLRERMIQDQLIARGIRDDAVLRAMRRIAREKFVPGALSMHAYDDCPLEIGCGQTISQPYIAAFMTELLSLRPEDSVLEIGTGCGYQTALLAELAGSVETIERIRTLYEGSRLRLSRLGYTNILFHFGDAQSDLLKRGGFDKIIVTAAAPEIPEILVDQLNEGGQLVIPVGAPGGRQNLRIGTKINGIFQTAESIAVRFVPLLRGCEEEA